MNNSSRRRRFEIADSKWRKKCIGGKLFEFEMAGSSTKRNSTVSITMINSVNKKLTKVKLICC